MAPLRVPSAGTTNCLFGGRAGTPEPPGTPTQSRTEEFFPSRAFLDCSLRLLALVRKRETFLCSSLVMAVNKELGCAGFQAGWAENARKPSPVSLLQQQFLRS